MDKHRIRRAVLDAVKYYDPAPAGIEDIAAYPRLAAQGVTLDQVQDETLTLIGYGFLENKLENRGVAVRLTVSGRSQINRDEKLDERIWGELAY